MRRWKRSGLERAMVVAPVFFGAALARPACAQTAADRAAAESLFDDGKALMAAGNATEACPKFEESQRLDPGGGTLMNLGRCYELTNRLASAWSTYLEAATTAHAVKNVERENMARELAAALAPRIAKLVIDVPGASRIPGLEVTRDGTATGAAQWGLAIPADVGEHAIVAKAPGRAEWRGVAVVSGEGTTTTIAVPVLAEQREHAEEHAPSTAPTDHPAAPSGGLGTQRIAAIVAGGVGVVGLGVGTVFGLMSKSNHDEAAKYCSGSACTDARGVSAGKDAHSQGNVATVGMVIGLVGLASGAALWFTAPRSDAPVQVGVGLDGVRVRGAF